VTTVDGEPAVLSGPSTDTAFAPLLVFGVAVVALVGFYGSICFMAQKDAEVRDRKFAEDAKTARMLALHAAAVARVDDHHEREKIAGRPLPYDEGDMKILDALTGSERDLAQQQAMPFPYPFQGAVETAKRIADNVSDEVGKGLGIGTVLALGIGAYMITR
jgi:hypothetical protein